MQYIHQNVLLFFEYCMELIFVYLISACIKKIKQQFLYHTYLSMGSQIYCFGNSQTGSTQSSYNKQELEKNFASDFNDHDVSFKQGHRFYCFQSGRVRNNQLCSKYQIQNPNSEVLLEDAIFYSKDAPTCFKEKQIQIFFKKQYSSKNLENSILQYTLIHTNDGNTFIEDYKKFAKKNSAKFMGRYNTSEQDAYGCCLALSYYTGAYYERVSRNSNIIFKLDVQINRKILNTEKFKWMRCILYWMYKALHYIPLYWGKVTRCIQLQQEESKIYQIGSIITWIQFSSSSYDKPTPVFEIRNTRFIIYSLTGRNIAQFSNYGNQSEVLFRPFTHFLVLHREYKEDKLFIYMREIFFGQSSKNILWVDDNIFDKNWQNKQLIQMAFLKDPLLNIIPKNSTQAAMAFLKSSLCQDRNPSEFRIMSDMTRNNENPRYNAGARFVRLLLPKYENFKVMIFAGNKANVEQNLQQLKVPKSQNIQVTVSSGDALRFLCFQ